MVLYCINANTQITKNNIMKNEDLLNLLNDNNQVLNDALEQIDFSTYVTDKIKEQIKINDAIIDAI
tara:strand:+ start:305 stop:502 length:198 start_codon:yes stop_codon:yes gene_type:complete